MSLDWGPGRPDHVCMCTGSIVLSTPVYAKSIILGVYVKTWESHLRISDHRYQIDIWFPRLGLETAYRIEDVEYIYMHGEFFHTPSYHLHGDSESQYTRYFTRWMWSSKLPSEIMVGGREKASATISLKVVWNSSIPWSNFSFRSLGVIVCWSHFLRSSCVRAIANSKSRMYQEGRKYSAFAIPSAKLR